MAVAQYANGTNGNTALPANVCTRQNLIDWGASLQAVVGTGLGQIENLSAPGFVVAQDLTPGAESFSTSGAAGLALLETVETLAAAGAVDVAKRTTRFNAAAGAYAMTLGNGTYSGQEKFFIFSGGAASTAAFNFTALANLVGGTAFTMDAVNHSLHLKWDTSQTKWVQMGGNCVIS